MNPRDKTNTTTGSTFSPGLSSVYNFNMVPDEPPAPADRVDAGRAFRTDSLWSAAARRRRAVRGPPGGVGEDGRKAELDPPAGPDELDGLDPSAPDSAPDTIGEEGCMRRRIVSISFTFVYVCLYRRIRCLGQRGKEN